MYKRLQHWPQTKKRLILKVNFFACQLHINLHTPCLPALWILYNALDLNMCFLSCSNLFKVTQIYSNLFSVTQIYSMYFLNSLLRALRALKTYLHRFAHIDFPQGNAQIVFTKLAGGFRLLMGKFIGCFSWQHLKWSAYQDRERNTTYKKLCFQGFQGCNHNY